MTILQIQVKAFTYRAEPEAICFFEGTGNKGSS
jgi:hypothetical protein